MGIPLFYLELSFGQFASLGPVRIWIINPAMKANESVSIGNVTNPSEEYFNNRVLKLTSGLGETGGISWELTLCLLLSWTIVFIVLTKGIKSLEKVVYVTATFPYILLTILLIRGATLEGHLEGIKFYLTPDLDRLSDAQKAVETTRANWGSQLEFILTLIGFAVGLGNVWRFPYLCFRNGGGAFLIPYFISLAVMGIPLFYLELSFGQFASLGPVRIWIINPAMKGMGYSMIIVSGLISIYYNVIIAVCVYYFFASMRGTLLWTTCNPKWSSCLCRDSTMNKSDPNPWNFTRPDCLNYTFTESAVTNPSEEYFFNRVLRQTSGLSETGGISWELALCLLLCWVIVFLVLTKGIESLGKVVYVTAIFPYVLLTALLIRGATLDGHMEGIKFYLTPDLKKLTDASVWSDAAVQIFYSLSACSGGLIAMASYNNFSNNVLRDTFLVPIINCLTSFYAGFVIFSVLGFMAYQKGVSVADVAAGGPGLAFIAYPEALAQMPVAPLWSILFFMMMMMLGFSSQFSIVETVLTGVLDDFPDITKSRTKTIIFRAGYCVFGFLLGLPMVTGCGFHLLDLVDNATGGFPLLFVGFFEISAIIYIYGFTRFRKDIVMMLGGSPLRMMFVNCTFYYFAPMWCIVTPLCLLGVIVFKCIQYVPKTVDNPDVFPVWADAIWWMIVLATIILIPIWFVGYYCSNEGCRVLIEANSPTSKWGPALPENRTGIYADDTYEMKDDPESAPPYNNFPSGYDVTNGDLSATQIPGYSDVLKVNRSFKDSAYASKEISAKADNTGTEKQSTETKADSKATKAEATVTEANMNGRAKDQSTGNKTDLTGADNPAFITE